ncbi:MAG: CSLREA domain-containing protein [Ardenticatenaceae bacterium]|nr:CSLREA domain-containing protein [Ardenticatenaceae bacterium]
MNRKYFPRLMIISLPMLLISFMMAMLAGAFQKVPLVHAATIEVTTAVDVVADDGFCSLREAITAANDDAPSGSVAGECPAGNGNDVIVLPALTYTLIITGANEDNNATGDLDVKSHITLQSEGTDKAIIEAGPDSASGIDRVIHIRSTGTLIGDNLIIRHGNAQGVCMPPFACKWGGGILSQGDLTLTNSIVTMNSAEWVGGGIYLGILTTNSLTTTVVSENTAGTDGGGIFQSDNLTIGDSTIISNTASHSGGGIYNDDSDELIILDSLVAANQATNNGGGLYVAGGVITRIENSTIWRNEANSGGGLFNASAPLYLRNDTFSANVAATTGGGIQNHSDAASIDAVNITVAFNSATSGGGIYNNQFGDFTLSNSLIANSLSGGDCATSLNTVVTNGLFNLIEDGSCILGSGSSDPLLGPLQDNGGATMTHALLPGSPAIDKNVGCTNVVRPYDQRQVSRPQGGGCDIGAYEYAPPSVTDFVVYLPVIMK